MSGDAQASLVSRVVLIESSGTQYLGLVRLPSVEHIAYAGHSDNIPWLCRIRFDLSPETIYKDTQVLRLPTVLLPPDPLQELDVGENLSYIKHEFLQETVFRWSTSDLSSG